MTFTGKIADIITKAIILLTPKAMYPYIALDLTHKMGVYSSKVEMDDLLHARNVLLFLHARATYKQEKDVILNELKKVQSRIGEWNLQGLCLT
jgi:hypothetical protein